MKLRSFKIGLIAALLTSLLLVPVQALGSPIIDSPYVGYLYDSVEEPYYSINGYMYQDSIDGYDLPIGAFKNPEDLFITDDNTLYIVDSGNHRIIHMNADKEILHIYGHEEGEGKLNGPEGVFITKEGLVYVADTLNRRVIVFNPEGEIHKIFSSPESSLLGEDFVYTPAKLVVDKRDYMYVINKGSDKGMMQIDPNGAFRGYYGANHMEFSWIRLFVRLIATKEQKEQMTSDRPPEFSNLYQDQEGFIYTTTLGMRFNQIKRLSAVGVDTLNTIDTENRYGDLYMPRINWESLYEAFLDVTVDDSGIITAIDQTTGKAFQYYQLGNLLFIFGGLGKQNGLFQTPVAIDHTSDGVIYVVDKTRGRIDRFATTPFGDKVHEASNLYIQGRYDEAKKPWNEVLLMNSNYDLAYRAIGKALEKEEHYGEALEYFKKSRSRSEYSVSFIDYRKEFLRENFTIFVMSIVMVYLLTKFGLKAISRRRDRKVNRLGLNKVKGA